jgi:hypothetical protein
VNGHQDVHGGALLDGADFFPDVRVEANLLHVDFTRPGGGSDPW